MRSDVFAYIEASKTGFAAYKEGDVQVSQGYRMWDSSVKPSAARGCWVVQGTTATTLSCALSQRGDLNGLRPYYADLNKEIAQRSPATGLKSSGRSAAICRTRVIDPPAARTSKSGSPPRNRQQWMKSIFSCVCPLAHVSRSVLLPEADPPGLQESSFKPRTTLVIRKLRERETNGFFHDKTLPFCFRV